MRLPSGASRVVVTTIAKEDFTYHASAMPICFEDYLSAVMKGFSGKTTGSDWLLSIAPPKLIEVSSTFTDIFPIYNF
jgi:hypothetical protein